MTYYGSKWIQRCVNGVCLSKWPNVTRQNEIFWHTVPILVSKFAFNRKCVVVVVGACSTTQNFRRVQLHRNEIISIYSYSNIDALTERRRSRFAEPFQRGMHQLCYFNISSKSLSSDIDVKLDSVGSHTRCIQIPARAFSKHDRVGCYAFTLFVVLCTRVGF